MVKEHRGHYRTMLVTVRSQGSMDNKIFSYFEPQIAIRITLNSDGLLKSGDQESKINEMLVTQCGNRIYQ